MVLQFHFISFHAISIYIALDSLIMFYSYNVGTTPGGSENGIRKLRAVAELHILYSQPNSLLTFVTGILCHLIDLSILG